MTGGSGKSRMELSYEPVKMLIREMDRMISTQEGELVVVLIPHPGQLYESGTEEVQKVLMEFGKGEGIYVLDLLPYFRKDFRQPERQESCFFPLDGHWTAHGHAIAGSAIFEYLSTNGLIGAARPLIRGG